MAATRRHSLVWEAGAVVPPVAPLQAAARQGRGQAQRARPASGAAVGLHRPGQASRCSQVGRLHPSAAAPRCWRRVGAGVHIRTPRGTRGHTLHQLAAPEALWWGWRSCFVRGGWVGGLATIGAGGRRVESSPAPEQQLHSSTGAAGASALAEGQDVIQHQSCAMLAQSGALTVHQSQSGPPSHPPTTWAGCGNGAALASRANTGDQPSAQACKPVSGSIMHSASALGARAHRSGGEDVSRKLAAIWRQYVH